ncbi:MAG TPA: hypothetical protein VGD50_02095, partial [Candidatus Baltobacteraceae bacterium]
SAPPRGSGVNVRFEDFGAAPLIAEYDAQRGLILINRRIIERVRAKHGDAAAQALIVCAIAHEAYHVAHPGCSEEAAHAYVHAQTQRDPRMLEAMAR